MTWLVDRLAFVVSLLAVAAVAFAAGRFSAPLQVEERERVEYRDRVVERVVQAKAQTKTVYVDRVITRDGEVRERIVERRDTKTDTKTDTARENAGSSDRSATTTARPDWRVGVLVGASAREPLLPIAGPLVIGVEVDRRIVGGLSVGVWASTSGAAGAALALEF